ncbi:MAG: response regulator [Microcystaceae cyanobacterium]
MGIMQGTLNEIDMRSLLQLIARSQQTGELLVEYYSPASVELTPPPSWYIFFVNGQIAYTTHSHSPSHTRLQEYLLYYGISSLPDDASITNRVTINDPEYGYLWLLLEKKVISPRQGKAILERMIQETLFDLFNLDHGYFHFQKGIGLTPQLAYVALAPLIPKIIQQVQQWKQFYPQIRQPEQCLFLKNPTALQTTLPSSIYHSLVHWADGQTSLRQLSRYLNRNLLTLAKSIYPYTERGWLQLIPSLSLPHQNLIGSPVDSGLKIVCIDDDPTVGQIIDTLLKDSKYGLTFFSHPLEALSQLFELRPDVILCDIAMPTLNGYELCGMLRHSHAFRHTPIIMLTEINEFLNRVRARMVGANDYLTKPLLQNELLPLLEQYRSSPSSSRFEND